MATIAASIVLYNTDKAELESIISACLNSNVPIDIYLVDNSPNDDLSYLQSDKRISYLKSDYNGGFGYGHNKAITHFKLLEKYDYCLVMNADIEFEFDVAKNIEKYMEENSKVGVLMPRILNPNGKVQFARRLLPGPFDIIRKRLMPQFLHSKRYEMINYEPNDPIDIVALCGCFMFIRVDALKVSGLFDERFFMYFEDFDLCRRIAQNFKSIYFPHATVIHYSNNEHRRSFKLLYYAVRAAILYFNKWGYIDKERLIINKKVYASVIEDCNV